MQQALFCCFALPTSLRKMTGCSSRQDQVWSFHTEIDVISISRTMFHQFFMSVVICKHLVPRSEFVSVTPTMVSSVVLQTHILKMTHSSDLPPTTKTTWSCSSPRRNRLYGGSQTLRPSGKLLMSRCTPMTAASRALTKELCDKVRVSAEKQLDF